MKKVYIAGGGIAGMSAGICLKKKGIPVTIYEKSSKVGQNRHGDYEGLENWIFNESISSFFSNIGFDYSQIQSSPVNSFMVHSIDKDPLLVESKKPFFFLVKSCLTVTLLTPTPVLISFCCCSCCCCCCVVANSLARPLQNCIASTAL